MNKRFFYIFLILPFLLSCGDIGQQQSNSQNSSDQKSIVNQVVSKAHLDVYKDPNCGCCVDWITHVENHGFDAQAFDTDQLAQLKMERGIPEQYQSCHTAISKEGYVFEGHVPARFIEKFLQEKPQGAFGLTVPSMPIGSPGMEVDNKFMPYKVFQLNIDGEPTVYAEVKSYAEQFE